VSIVVVVANVVVNVENVSNLQWFPSNLHIHPLQSANVPHPLKTLCHVPFLTPWFYSFSYPSCGDVICGISYLCSLNYFSCGNVIYGTIVICLIANTIVGIALTIVGTIDGSTLPFIIFCAFKFVLSYSLFTPKHEALPSSIMFFLLITFLGEFVAAFILFSNYVFISS